jgi:hypothetical protein
MGATIENQRLQYEARLKELLQALSSGSSSEATILPSRLSIINYVKAKLDELVPEGEGLVFKLSEEPNVSDPWDLLINAHLDESTKDVILTAPIGAMVPHVSDSTTGTPFSNGSLQGYISLPPNFLRLSQFKMEDWLRTLEEAITPSDPRYKLQSTPMRGGCAKPVAVLSWKSGITPTRVLEYYSIESSHNIEKLLFMLEMTAESFIESNPKLLPSLAWMCAGKIMQIIGNLDASKMAAEQVKFSYTNL